jgi:hypothetical protein
MSKIKNIIFILIDGTCIYALLVSIIGILYDSDEWINFFLMFAFFILLHISISAISLLFVRGYKIKSNKS